MKAQLAFYKGKGDLTDKLIRWWTDSKYSHVELIVDGMWLSSSPRDGKLRSKHIVPNLDNWDFVEVDVMSARVHNVFNKYRGTRYDYLGIFLSQIIPLDIDDKNKMFCSEFCATALGYDKPNQYSPGSLYEKVKQNVG